MRKRIWGVKWRGKLRGSSLEGKGKEEIGRKGTNLCYLELLVEPVKPLDSSLKSHFILPAFLAQLRIWKNQLSVIAKILVHASFFPL